MCVRVLELVRSFVWWNNNSIKPSGSIFLNHSSFICAICSFYPSYIKDNHVHPNVERKRSMCDSSYIECVKDFKNPEEKHSVPNSENVLLGIPFLLLNVFTVIQRSPEVQCYVMTLTKLLFTFFF